MKKVKHDTKIGLALTKSELSDIITCVDEIQQRMEVSRDKGWGTQFNGQIISRLQGLLKDLKTVQEQPMETGAVEYEGLPKEDCEICD